MNNKSLIHLLTIHQTILQPTWMESIMKSHNIQPYDLQITRNERQTSPSILETHHMIYRELGGSSKQRNEVSLPCHIHRRIHRTFPDLLPHEMIMTTMDLKTNDQKRETIYLPHILSDLGITTPDINPIVAKALAKH